MDLLSLLNLQGFIVVCAIFVPLERLFALHKDQRIFRRGWPNDLIYVFVNKLVIQAGLLIVIIGVGVCARWLVPAALQQTIAAQPDWLQIVQAIIIADIGFYAAHRMFHTVPWLWRFHAVHHSIEEMDWLAAARVHPVDQIVTKGISLLPLYALGYSNVALGVYAVLYMWQSYLIHANVRLSFGPLRWLIASPEFHHWHHSNQREAYNMNYAGQLAVLDRLFGTLHMPPGQMPSSYGVNEPVPQHYAAQLLYPFTRSQPKKPRRTPEPPASYDQVWPSSMPVARQGDKETS
jgi:sterol desaturase/sphingolipid hydroxylase (fatty acid hydroxylase superfamily)